MMMYGTFALSNARANRASNCSNIPHPTQRVDDPRHFDVHLDPVERIAAAPNGYLNIFLARTGFAAAAWAGIAAPPGTQQALVELISAAVVEALRQPDVASRAASLGLDLVGTTPEQFAALQRAEIAKWGEVIRAAKVQAD